ncbi:hypothetical protein BH23ACT10_BH23ACT10_11360 [soil metagenome]
MGRYEATIRGWLVADLAAPAKQRHTARRVWQRLIAEQGADVGESTVRAFVASVRAEIAVEQGSVADVMVVQGHAPEAEAEAEVDFGEFYATIAGAAVRVHLFVMRLSCSGRAFVHAYGHQAQEAFFDGHVRGFAWLGGVPGRVRYDNLKAAVTRILTGRDRVEGEVGRFRRNHLVPVPEVGSLGELNAHIAAACAADDARVISGRRETVSAIRPASRSWFT